MNSNTSAAKRVFFAIPVPMAIAQQWQQEMTASLSEEDVHWTREGNHHITVVFIGSMDAALITPLLAAIETALQTLTTFSVHVDRLAAFPPQKSKLIAAHVAEQRELQHLHDVVTQCCQQLGMDVDTRSYQPHITLCRLPTSLARNFESITLPSPSIPANELILYESQSSAEKASVYVPLHRFALISS